MEGTPKKIAEIAEILGVSEAECKIIASEYEVILPAKKVGRVSLYDDNAVDRFRKIADLRVQGLPKEVIIPAIRGGKSLEERAAEDMKKMGVELPPSPAAPREPPKQIPRSETEEELILAVRSLETKVASMDHRFAAVRETNEADTAAVLKAVLAVSADVQALKEQMHMLWDQIAALEEYLREENGKPFWKR
ncbi:MAG: MerR family transcriptional regulator [Methanocorpusculum sp.]|nr:MerR family transcriptional regulator [Methanocorpusculum sp.]